MKNIFMCIDLYVLHFIFGAILKNLFFHYVVLIIFYALLVSNDDYFYPFMIQCFFDSFMFWTLFSCYIWCKYNNKNQKYLEIQFSVIRYVFIVLLWFSCVTGDVYLIVNAMIRLSLIYMLSVLLVKK